MNLDVDTPYSGMQTVIFEMLTILGVLRVDD